MWGQFAGQVKPIESNVDAGKEGNHSRGSTAVPEPEDVQGMKVALTGLACPPRRWERGGKRVRECSAKCK